jgi:hypothetical protein
MRIQGYAKMGDAVACITYRERERARYFPFHLQKKHSPLQFFPSPGMAGRPAGHATVVTVCSARKRKEHYSTAGTGSAICRKTDLCSNPNMHPMESTHSAPMLA